MSEPPAAEPPAGRPAVRAEGLLLAHDGHEALRIDDLTVPACCVTAVIGPNGSGKTTLLAAVSGLLTPVRGSLEVLGAPPGRRGDVGHVLQHVEANAALPLTVREVVRMGRYARRGMLGRLTAEDRRAVDRALERMGIADLQREQLAELSGGQRQRAFVAQGLAQEADLLLLDEPATGLDAPTRDRIGAVLPEECAAGRSVIVTTHDLADASVADFVVLLAGRVVGAGPPEEVLVTERLQDAYGGRLGGVGAGAIMFDDPHHRPAEQVAGEHPRGTRHGPRGGAAGG